MEKVEYAQEQHAPTFKTRSGIPVKRVYTPEDVKGMDYERDLGEPGEFPCTRGIHKDMYQGKSWITQMYSGFGTPDDTNKRFKYLLSQGIGSIDPVPDPCCQMGIDYDHPIGRMHGAASGSPHCTLRDTETDFDGIPLDKVVVSLHNPSGSAPVIFASYVACAQKRGIDLAKLRGSILNEPLDTNYSDMWIPASPLNMSPNLAVDILEYCVWHMPNFRAIVPCGYDAIEAGANSVQELAFVFADAMTYIDIALKRGLTIDQIIRKMVFSTGTGMDFFEEIAKVRAGRRLWNKILRDKYQAKDPKTYKAYFSQKTAGSSLTFQEPVNNIIRTTLESLAGVLGGCQAIGPCGYDEAYTIPTEEAAKVSANIQKILYHESGVINTVDPLAGSYYVESLTNEIEKRTVELLQEIDRRGGMIKAIESGWVKGELDNEVLKQQKEIDDGKRIVVGLNKYQLPEDQEVQIPIYRQKAADASMEKMVERLVEFKRKRDLKKTRQALLDLSSKAEKKTKKDESENLIPPIIEALKADATMGEILGVIRECYGLSYDPFNMINRPDFLN